MMIKRFINWFFSDNDEVKKAYKIVCYDKQDNEYSLIELLQQLTQHVIKLEERIRINIVQLFSFALRINKGVQFAL